MLVFHPALDPSHAAFRALMLLHAGSSCELQRDKFRILDFYLAFPNLVGLVRLPPKHRREKNALSGKPNKYEPSGEPREFFRRIGPIHEQGVRLLVGGGLVDKGALSEGVVQLSATPLPQELARRIQDRLQRQEHLVRFLVDVLGALDYLGENGLKHRSRLMEHRYDAV